MGEWLGRSVCGKVRRSPPAAAVITRVVKVQRTEKLGKYLDMKCCQTSPMTCARLPALMLRLSQTAKADRDQDMMPYQLIDVNYDGKYL